MRKSRTETPPGKGATTAADRLRKDGGHPERARRPSAPPRPHRMPQPPSPRRRWLVTLVAAAVLGLFGWLALPRLGVTDPTARVAPALLALVGWVLLNRREDVRERAANHRFVTALAAAHDPELKASLEELGTVRARMDAVLDRLKTQRFGARWGGRYLYQLPWYLVVGAPGSGKTTALANARLGAALGAGLDGLPVPNLGGTRNTDWWFTDHAVLIDTAGRYTTQDSRRAVDGRVWSGLLTLLKDHRPRQPVNGVLLTVSLSDLAEWTEEERRGHAITIRQRLAELRRALALRVPVYLLCTKVDLVPGFATFFDPLDRGERAQVWGVTFPLETDQRGALAVFRARFPELLHRLDARLLERLHQEPDIGRRSDVFTFPQRLSELEPALAELIDIAFTPEAEEEAPLLRGFYLTSATQAGAAPEAPADPFFLQRLLPELVFPEASLVGVDRRMERAQRRRGALATVTTLAVGVALGAFWLTSGRDNAALLAEAAAAVSRAEDAVRVLDTPPRSLTRVADADVTVVLPLLDALRAVPSGWEDRRDRWPPLAMTGGLYQGDRLTGPAVEAYRRALRGLFLSRIVLRLEDQLRTNWARPDLLALALRAYRMIGGAEPMDPGYLAQWLAADWQRTLPGAGRQAARRALGDHFAALIEVGFAPVPLDVALVARAETELKPAKPAGGAPSSPPPAPPQTPVQP